VSETVMKVGSVAPWFGGKRTLAPTIVREIGPCSSFWELCCGSLAVLFSKPPSASEAVVDLHGDVTNLARVLASDQWTDLAERVERTIFSDALFEEAKERLDQAPGDEVDRAYDYLVVSWMGLNGVAGTDQHNLNFCVRYTSNGGDPGRRWRSVGDSLPAWHDRLKGVKVLRRDIFSVAERIEDKPGTVIYCDPPYIAKGSRYLHEFTAADHERLAALLSRFERTRVVVSYYDHPTLDVLYDGWTKVSLSASKKMVNSIRRASGDQVAAPEILLINGPSYTRN